MTASNRIRQPQTYVLNGVEQSGVLAVPLQKGQFMLINEQDWPLISFCNWTAMEQSHTSYAISCDGKNRLAHRIILGASKGQCVDHINGDGLDNRRANIRLSTVKENNRNLRINKRNTSGFKGVDFVGAMARARIRVDRRQIHLGHFPSPELAAQAYDAAAIQYHGEFARLNFPVTRKEAQQ